MRSMVLVVVAMTTAAAVSVPRTAEACSPPFCWGGAFVPGNQARVPANVPGLVWRPMAHVEGTPDPNNVLLASAASPTRPIAFTAQPLDSRSFLLVPVAPLAPGNYALTDRSVCTDTGDAGPQVAFTVVAAAAMPSTLGALYATPSSRMDLPLATRGGGCSSQATIDQVEIDQAPSLVAIPWRDMLQFETLVDGLPWRYESSTTAAPPPGASELGRGRDRVFQLCSSTDPTVSRGVAAGKHVVTMRATLPGSTQVIDSEPLEVTLSCGNDSPGGQATDTPPVGCRAGSGAGLAAGLALLALAAPRRRSRFRLVSRS